MQNRSLSIIDYIISALMAFIILLVFVPVVTRTIFNYSVVWADEMARVSMVWIVFLGMAACYRHREHIEIDILYNAMSKSVKWIFRLVGDLVWLYITILLVMTSYELTLTSWSVVLPATGFPVGIMSLPLLIGSVIMTIYILISLFKLFKKEQRPDRLSASQGN